MRPPPPPWRWNHQERSSALAVNLCRTVWSTWGVPAPHLTLPRVPIDPTAALANPSILETYAVVVPATASPPPISLTAFCLYRAFLQKINLCRLFYLQFYCFLLSPKKALCQLNPNFTVLFIGLTTPGLYNAKCHKVTMNINIILVLPIN